MRNAAAVDADTYIQLGLQVVGAEAQAIVDLKPRINDDFVKSCHLMMDCKGRVVVIGMGKSGHIGRKIAATMASTGTPAFFVHPGEASHGDLGMITADDVVLALSNSGETGEILTLLPLIKRLDTPLIAMTGKTQSTLAKAADATLDVSVAEEACPLNLAPSSSTTAALVMGDALALTLLEAKGFTEHDFAFSHPNGSLGRRLLLRVQDIMHKGNAIPQVTENCSFQKALLEMTQKGLGMTAVLGEHNSLKGIFTDGDLRRAFDKSFDPHTTAISELMTSKVKTSQPDMLAAEALQLMESHKINGLLVTNEDNQVVGAFNMHDLLRAGVV